MGAYVCVCVSAMCKQCSLSTHLESRSPGYEVNYAHTVGLGKKGAAHDVDVLKEGEHTGHGR